MAESLEAEIRQLYEDWIANPSPVVCARLADRLRIAGRNDEALEVSRRGQKDWPGNNSIRMVIARCLRSSGDSQEARSAFEEVLKADPFNLVALKNLAEMSMAEGRYRDAVKLFGDYVFENPGDPEAQLQLEEAKRKERTAPEPTPVPPVDDAAPPPAATVEPPSPAAAPAPAEPAAAVEQAFAAVPEVPPAPEHPAVSVEDIFASDGAAGSGPEPAAPGQAPPTGPVTPPGEEPVAADAAAASLPTVSGGPGRDAGPEPVLAEETAGVPGTVTSTSPAPVAGAAPLPGAGPEAETAADARIPDAAPAAPVPEAPAAPAPEAPVPEEAPPAPFPQTGRMERILRNQGMAVPDARPAAVEARPAAVEARPAAPAPEHAPEPRTAQGLKREPRSLFDLFSPEERAELFLEPYRQEEK